MTKDEFKSKREYLGYTQSQLAELFRVHTGTIARWEQGIIAIPYTAIIALESLQGIKPLLIYLDLQGNAREVTAEELEEIAADPGRQWEGPYRVAGRRISLYLEIEPVRVPLAQFAAATPDNPADRAGTKYPWGDDNPIPPAQRHDTSFTREHHDLGVKLMAEFEAKYGKEKDA